MKLSILVKTRDSLHVKNTGGDEGLRPSRAEVEEAMSVISRAYRKGMAPDPEKEKP